MGTVQYKHQPGIDKTKGTVPLAGTEYIYTISKLLWPQAVENFLSTKLIGKSLHICCGKSKLGDIRLDMFEEEIDIKADASRLPLADKSFDTLLIDPPYNGKFQWNHDMLSELGRIARIRFIFQHWFIPVDKKGFFKKDHEFILTELYTWMPKTYFGRAQMISIFDRQIEYII